MLRWRVYGANKQLLNSFVFSHIPPICILLQYLIGLSMLFPELHTKDLFFYYYYESLVFDNSIRPLLNFSRKPWNTIQLDLNEKFVLNFIKKQCCNSLNCFNYHLQINDYWFYGRPSLEAATKCLNVHYHNLVTIIAP